MTLSNFALTILFFCFTTFVFGQNGQLFSQEKVDLEQEDFWGEISINDTLKSGFTHLEHLDFYKIKYWSDSLPIEGILVEPKAEGNYPVVIFNRGGNRNFASLNIEMIARYTGKLASEGYVIIASNYREQDEFGGKDTMDVLNIIEATQYCDKADTSKIGMFGWSRGGMMTYLALKQSDKIKAAIIGNGPTDLFSTIKERPIVETKVLSECIPNYYENKNEALKSRSVIYWPNLLSKHTHLLVLNGKKDKRLDYHQSVLLAEKLKLINYNFELKLYETDHFFSDKKNELNSEVINWFNKHLKQSESFTN